jgi:SAM-dependent methyltransferase
LAKEVVGVDISSAIDAAAVTVAGRANVHLVQASVYELPFKPGVFDLCYSIGVIQHTPQPSLAVESLPRVVKDSGRLVLTIYERKPWTYLNAKYLVRPLTKRMNQKLLLQMIYAVAPILFPMTDVLYRLPLLNRFFAFVIPFADYTMVPGLSFAQRYRAAVLDTFDMLSPSYDQPQTMTEVSGAMSRGGIKSVRRMPAPGLTVVGTKS